MSAHFDWKVSELCRCDCEKASVLCLNFVLCGDAGKALVSNICSIVQIYRFVY